MIDILHYFFKKMQTIYLGNSNTGNTGQLDTQQTLTPKLLQNKLIELENYIIQIGNEKAILNQKYAKLLNIQSKLSESFDSPSNHLETVKKLNEKLYDMNEENKYLKDKLNEFTRIDEALLKIDKDNVFTNNYIKDGSNYKTIMDNADTSYNNILEHNFKTLEQRVNELEKGLCLKRSNDFIILDKTRDSFIENSLHDLSGNQGIPLQRQRNKSAQSVIIKTKKKVTVNIPYYRNPNS
jgi:hypothetical protein